MGIIVKECPVCGKRTYPHTTPNNPGFYDIKTEKFICAECELFGKRLNHFLDDRLVLAKTLMKIESGEDNNGKNK